MPTVSQPRITLKHFLIYKCLKYEQSTSPRKTCKRKQARHSNHCSATLYNLARKECRRTPEKHHPDASKDRSYDGPEKQNNAYSHTVGQLNMRFLLAVFTRFLSTKLSTLLLEEISYGSTTGRGLIYPTKPPRSVDSLREL